MGVFGNIFLVMATIAIALSKATSEEFCPDNCKCDLVKKVVDCRNAGLTRIPWNLPDPANLRQIDLSGNDIHEVLLETVSYQNLELLDLSHNRIVSIDDGVMETLPHLESLYLQNNDLSELSPRTLSGLKALSVLDLSHNRIQVVKDKVFSDLEYLQELNLAGNGVQQIRDDSFLGLKNLRTLNLGDNRLANIPVQALKKPTQIAKLYLNENQFQNVPMHAFRLLEGLRELYLQDNHIAEISENTFYDHEKLDTPDLETINLKGNRLEKVPTEAIHKLKSLLSIDLSENSLRVIDPDAFKGLNRVRRISLNSLPELEVVRKYALSELNNLEVLEMHSNRALENIEEDAFLATPALRKVDLHANQLHNMPATLFDWDKIEQVDLRYNPWQCDCHLKWLPAALTSLAGNASRHLADAVHCAKPENLAGQRVQDLAPAQLTCPEPEEEFEEHILIGIIASISLVLFVIMVYLLYKHDYCSLSGKKVPRSANYRVQRHCNGHGPARHGNSEERVHIAANEQQVAVVAPGDNIA